MISNLKAEKFHIWANIIYPINGSLQPEVSNPSNFNKVKSIMMQLISVLIKQFQSILTSMANQEGTTRISQWDSHRFDHQASWGLYQTPS